MVLGPLCAQGAHSAHAPPPFLTIEVIPAVAYCILVFGCLYAAIAASPISTLQSLKGLHAYVTVNLAGLILQLYGIS